MNLLSAVVIVADAGLRRAEISVRSVQAAGERLAIELTCPRFVMRFPFKTETDAFRVAVALGLVAGASLLVGLLASRAYGVVLFAAGIAAGITFELAGRETGRGSALQEAADAPHLHGASGGTRHVLVVTSVKLAGEELRRELAAGGAGVELDVLAPILASRSHYWASDLDREREEARERLEASLAWAAEQGFAAKGEVGDADPLLAIEDELRDFGADEVIVVTHSGERTSWLANRMLGHLARELDVPVREIALGGEQDRSALPPPSPAE
ncbi:MAG: hypothetical protein M3P44_11980 [Actinomycetota bacterium]|nr:hypothetical protein [Actinomycetota bacterium]